MEILIWTALTSNTSIEEFKLEYNQAQPQLNSSSTQTTELGTTQLTPVISSN